jgi:hypothetical protein
MVQPSLSQSLAPRAGLEPATFRLTAERSTIELPGNCDAESMLQKSVVDACCRVNAPACPEAIGSAS